MQPGMIVYYSCNGYNYILKLKRKSYYPEYWIADLIKDLGPNFKTNPAINSEIAYPEKCMRLSKLQEVLK